MSFHLVQRRMFWFPTLWGWACLVVIGSIPGLLCWFKGESFFSPTERLPADVLVVEGWIGTEGVDAAASEFGRGGYQYVVTTGGLTGERWNERRWNFADMAERELIRAGVPKDRIIFAPADETEGQRTFEMAVAAGRTLDARNIHPKAINVFTMGAHARRSRLIFAKVFGPGTEVGVISWIPPGYKNEPWWRSSDRAGDLVKETVGYLFEALLNSGRSSNHPAEHPR